jgi:FkbM family methyltransferase
VSEQGCVTPEAETSRVRSTNTFVNKASWEISVFVSRWRIRIHYAIAVPFVYRNWWSAYLAKGRSVATVLELRNGLKYIVRPGTSDFSVINEAVILNPYLGPGYLKLEPDATVVDVGANIGDFTIQAAKLCPAGRVYAIEPIAGYCECIERQLQLNRLENAVVLNLALGGQEGEIEIHEAGLQSSAYWGDRGGTRVRLSTLQSVMRENNIDKIDLLKMDCEGAEWDILPAAEPILPKIRQLCIEYHNGKLTADWLETWLTRNGYTVRRTAGAWNGLLWAWR